jgi:multidrug efflux pump subunit AcrA (membrane-fusion protein)
MREETTNPMTRGSEESLRAEIDDLKRQLAQKREAGEAQAHKAARPSNHTVRNLILLTVVVLIGAFVIGYLPRHRRQLQLVAEAGSQNEALPEVSFVAVTRASAVGNLVLPGNIQAVTEAPVLARAEGFVNKRYVDIGDRVTAGQLLAEIEATDLDQQVRQAQASLQQSRADLERATAALEQGKANESLAKVTAGRWESLSRQGIASRQENDQYQLQYQAQIANVRALDRAAAAAKSSIDAAEANVARFADLKSYLKVKAPFAGVITLRNVDVGVGEFRKHAAVPHRSN